MVHSLNWTGLTVLLSLLVTPALAQQSQTPPPPLPPPSGSSSNQSSVDPTKNVLDLVGALKEMLKEIRIVDKELVDSKFKGERELSEQRGVHNRDIIKLHAEFNERLAILEKSRVDQIRTVDKAAVDATAAQAVTQAAQLAKALQDTTLQQQTQTARVADDLRVLVKTTADEANRTATQNAQSIQTQFASISSRLTAVEQAGAEGKGSARFQDPALAQALERISTNQTKVDAQLAALSQSRATVAGVDQGSTTTWALVAAIFVMLMTFGGLFLNMRNQLLKNGKPA